MPETAWKKYVVVAGVVVCLLGSPWWCRTPSS